MSTGDISLSENNIESVLDTAEFLEIYDLKQLCFKFMEGYLIGSEPVQCWKLAMAHKQTALSIKCKEEVVSNIKNLNSDSALLKFSEKMMKEILDAINLNVTSEVEACEVFMNWLDLHTREENGVHPEQFLPLIKWSGVSVNYIKSKLLQNVMLTSSAASMTFLSKVINYHLSGIQFEGLKTFCRPSTGMENCLVVFGLNAYGTKTEQLYQKPRRLHRMTQQLHQISLQQLDCVLEITEIPAVMSPESQACAYEGSVYVTGIGGSDKEAWKFDTLSSSWFRCTDMITSRRRHCAVIVDSQMYVLGGWVDAGSTVLGSVECYNKVTNKWHSAGNLIHAVWGAACVTYKNYIYVFGGWGSEDRVVAHVQVYNPATQRCTYTSMPGGYNLMRPVLWDTSVILLDAYTCLLYDFQTKMWLERQQFKTDLVHFGVVLDNQTIYIAGGGTYTQGLDNQLLWSCKDEVKCISVLDIIQDKPAIWKHHGKLPKRALVHAYCAVTLPTIQ